MMSLINGKTLTWKQRYLKIGSLMTTLKCHVGKSSDRKIEANGLCNDITPDLLYDICIYTILMYVNVTLAKNWCFKYLPIKT